MSIRINNRQARALWLSTQGLAAAPTGPLDVMAIIRQLGFVQLDTIQLVARAHHHIIWSRNQNYREAMLDHLLARDRQIFEHFTHDASVIPMQTYPMWRRQFRRMQDKLDRTNWYATMLKADGRKRIKARIRAEGPLSTQAFDSKAGKPKTMWSRPPHKLALDYMWYAGELATCHRVGFTKYYDLAERVFSAELRAIKHSDQAQIDWLCASALTHLGVGTISEVQKFWDAVSPAEARQWAQDQASSLTSVQVQAADNSWSDIIAPADIEARLDRLPKPTSRLRILNPFDPAIRDRARLNRLFGFEYTNEMFVPKANRKWGYYVYPILQGDCFVGRLELKADRAKSQLMVLRVWPEKGSKWMPKRSSQLTAELQRMARFISMEKIVWNCPDPAVS